MTLSDGLQLVTLTSSLPCLTVCTWAGAIADGDDGLLWAKAGAAEAERTPARRTGATARWICMWGLLHWIDRKCVAWVRFWQPGTNPASANARSPVQRGAIGQTPAFLVVSSRRPPKAPPTAD